MSDFKPNQPPDRSRQALAATDIEAFLTQHPGWSVATGGDPAALEKTWRFADFAQAMAFGQRAAALAERLNHHPDLLIGWGRCTVRWTTHDTGGVSARDLDAARQTDALAAATVPMPPVA